MSSKEAIRTNFEEKAAYLARSLPGMSVIDHGDYLLVDSSVASDTFNVIVARTLSNTHPLLEEGVGTFMRKRTPMALWYWEEGNDQPGIHALLAYGLTNNERDVAMVADVAQVNSQLVLPLGLTIKQVETGEELRDFASVLVRLFGTSEEAQGVAAYFDLLSRQPLSQFPAMRYYIGIYEGKVVATGTLFIGSETVGIYDIVTDDAVRRRGIGSAIFAHLLRAAGRLGRRYAILQASPDGLGIYARAGFVGVGTVRVFENRTLIQGMT